MQLGIFWASVCLLRGNKLKLTPNKTEWMLAGNSNILEDTALLSFCGVNLSLSVQSPGALSKTALYNRNRCALQQKVLFQNFIYHLNCFLSWTQPTWIYTTVTLRQ